MITRLTAWVGFLWLVAATPNALALALADDGPWFQHVRVGMEVGPTGAQFGNSDPSDARYAARFDGAEIVRRCVAARSQYVVIWARDGDYAYYDSQLLPRPPGLGTRDPLREAVAAAHAHKLPILAYCVAQQGGLYLQAHPEFAMRGPDGKPLGRFCFNSGYLDALKAIVAEQLAYGIDGFHIDMLDQGFGPPHGCWCDTCRRRFEAEHGTPMPLGVTWDADWDRMLDFRYQTSQRFERALCDHIKKLNPRATVDFNYHGNPPFSWEVGQRPVQHATQGDFVTGETGVWGFSALTVGLNAEFYRAATSGKPFQVAIQRGVRMYHDQTTRPLADIRWELLTLLAHGAFVTMVDKAGFDGGLDPVAYDRIGAAFADALDRGAEFGHSPVADVGIYFSSRTRDWVGREQPARSFAGFQGAHKAMVYDHIPWGIVLDENATPATLQRFPVVLLPNVGIISDREVELLRGYVAGGGKLIVTGLSGCHDRWGKLQETSSLESLVGARFVRALESKDNWVKLDATATPEAAVLGRDIPHAQTRLAAGEAVPFLVKGSAAVLEPTTGQPLGELLRPHRTVRQQQGKEGVEWPMSADTPVGPAILINRLGSGMVLTFAGSPDEATASEHHIVEARRLLANAVRLLHPTPRVRITAPATVEAVVTDDPTTRTLRVHLLGYNAPPQTTPAKDRPFVLPALIEDPPLFRATVDCSDLITNARASRPATQIQHQGHRVEALVHDVHDVLILSY